MLLRQKADGPLQGKQFEFIPCGQKLQDNGERRPGSALIKDHIFLILEVRETFLTRKLLGGQKRDDVKSTHSPFYWNPSWL